MSTAVPRSAGLCGIALTRIRALLADSGQRLIRTAVNYVVGSDYQPGAEGKPRTTVFATYQHPAQPSCHCYRLVKVTDTSKVTPAEVLDTITPAGVTFEVSDRK